MLTEYATKEQREEIDRILAGPKAQSSRRERVDVARAVGGAVRRATTPVKA